MDSFHYGVLLLVLSQPHPTPAALATFSISNPPTCVEYVCCAIAGICGSHARGVANFGTEVHAACLSAMGQFPPVRIPVFIMGCCVALLRMMDQNNDCGTTTTNNNNNNDNHEHSNNSNNLNSSSSTSATGRKMPDRQAVMNTSEYEFHEKLKRIGADPLQSLESASSVSADDAAYVTHPAGERGAAVILDSGLGGTSV
mmetsp:Transcript_25106/g.42017  ORF Transcript_25106/g.42017 Transcript_25106/m.42017 type:complete len:199 (-) Transcript_25106:85-681(-)